MGSLHWLYQQTNQPQIVKNKVNYEICVYYQIINLFKKMMNNEQIYQMRTQSVLNAYDKIRKDKSTRFKPYSKYHSIIFMSQQLASKLQKANPPKLKIHEEAPLPSSLRKSLSPVKKTHQICEFDDNTQKLRALTKESYCSNTAIMSNVKMASELSFSFYSDSKKANLGGQTTLRKHKSKQKSNSLITSSLCKLKHEKQDNKNKQIMVPQKIQNFMHSYYQFNHKKMQAIKSSRNKLKIQPQSHDQPDKNSNLRTSQKIHNKQEQLQVQYQRWAARSSSEWIDQDIKNEDKHLFIQQVELKKKKRNKQIITPKNYLFMSLYLRIREKVHLKTQRSKAESIHSSQIMDMPQTLQRSKYYRTETETETGPDAYADLLYGNMNGISNVERYRSRTKPYGSLNSIKHQHCSKKTNTNIVAKGPTIMIQPW